MNLLKILFAVIITLSANAYSQTVYEIPFASKDNIIELEIVNDSEISANELNIKIMECPEWIKFQNSNFQMINKNDVPEFKFDILKEAPVNEETTLKFIAEQGNYIIGEKVIQIAVAAPVNYELYQNYPNPFNPATTISYQLPALSKVNLKIYDILGSEVETLIEIEQPAGSHKLNWNAGRYASGMFIYQLIAEKQNGEINFFRKKMLLVK